MKSLLSLLILLFASSLVAQTNDGAYALPQNLRPLPAQVSKSYPKPISVQQLRDGFAAPPKGYGNVPFYWWSGDSLTKEKLTHQLELLKDASTDGFAVSYIHTHPQANADANAKGYGMYGATEAGRPALFTPQWYELWKWFSAQCARNNIGVGLDDYTFAWEGNGYYPDEIAALPNMKNYQGQLQVKIDTLMSNATYTYVPKANRVSCVAWRKGERVDIGSNWTAPSDGWMVYDYTTTPNHILAPGVGNELVSRYFQRIEDKMSEDERRGADYYFQDELHIPLNMLTWSEDLTAEFKARKGYDLLPYLAALSGDIGKMTEKVRLDYADVLMTLAEERYFMPIFNWHWERGRIYGADNFSRGMNPTEYVDYFRANRWYTAPGNDAPARGSSLMSSKVSSSIAHLYQRPRTWLEAFHSMGWSSSGEWLTAQLDHHLIAGGNLLCLHGLYYSTRGSWWEWAPPDFHFRMPYWDHMKHWLKYAERMCYVLSQGSHVCDIAVVYPTEGMQAVQGKTGDMAFDASRKLFYAGLDFDFIDYQSVARATANDGNLSVSGEQYKVLVLADLPAVHHATLEKALEFYRKGGTVVALGELPFASTLDGRSAAVDSMVRQLFGVTAAELKSGKSPVNKVNAQGGKTYYTTVDQIAKLVPTTITPDFVGGGDAKVLHRRIGNSDLYMVMNVAPGHELFFRAKGKVQLWDAMSGTVREIPALSVSEQGTHLRFNNQYERSYLVVFTEGQPQLGDGLAAKDSTTHTVYITGEWEVEQQHTMDNTFGDFRMPVREQLIGAEARTFRVAPLYTLQTDSWHQPSYNHTQWDSLIYGYGTQAEYLYATPEQAYQTFRTAAMEGKGAWQPYRFSWQYGVWENPGNEGYHGLKGMVSDGFFIMGNAGSYAFRTQAYVRDAAQYTLVTDGVAPTEIWIDGKAVDNKVRLSAGWYSLLVLYSGITQGNYIYTYEMVDTRLRSAIVLIKANTPLPSKHNSYSPTLGMRWNDTQHKLPYNPHGATTTAYAYRFTAPAGLEQLQMSIHARKAPRLWVDGQAATKVQSTGYTPNDGLSSYTITLDSRKERASQVALEITPDAGYADAAAIPYPIRLQCGKGYMEAGNWGSQGQLVHYSGGMWYRKTINITTDMLAAQHVYLNLGEVVATCEIHVNGTNMGVLLNSPFRTDIRPALKAGDNKVEVLVYSTLSNHYQTVPTPKHYRGDAKAGMMGEVKVEW